MSKPDAGRKEVIMGLKITEPEENCNDTVHIPDCFDDSDTESDTLSEKIRRLEGYGDLGCNTLKICYFGNVVKLI